MTAYRVIDLATETIEPEAKIVDAMSPEHAAQLALGVDLVRSGARRNLRARVYSESPGQPKSMVRLYSKVSEEG